MINEMSTFSKWNKDTQAACVMMYNMSLGQAPAAPPVQQPSQRNSVRPTRVYHGPKARWSDDDRLALFEEFKGGNRDWNGMARRFRRSSLAIRAQFDKEYSKFSD